MTKEVKTEQITIDQVEAKADELSQKLNTSVKPLVFQRGETSEKIVGYFTEPPRLVKMRAMDKVGDSASTAGAELLEACLLKEYSDPRIFSEASENDDIYMGACYSLLGEVKVLANAYKKK